MLISDLSLIISIDHRAVFGDDERVGVVFADDGAQAADLIFGDEDIEDVHRLAGVFAHALVARDAAVQVNEDLVLHLGLRTFVTTVTSTLMFCMCSLSIAVVEMNEKRTE